MHEQRVEAEKGETNGQGGMKGKARISLTLVSQIQKNVASGEMKNVRGRRGEVETGETAQTMKFRQEHSFDSGGGGETNSKKDSERHRRKH